MTNQEVLQLQKTLNAQGYRDKNGKKLAEDGLLGVNTTYALQKMLNDNGFRDASGRSLTTDGIWGPNTQAAYNKYSGGARPPKTTSSPISLPSATPAAAAKPPAYSNQIPGLPAPAQPSSYQDYRQKKDAELFAEITSKMSPRQPAAKPVSTVLHNIGASSATVQKNAATAQSILNQQDGSIAGISAADNSKNYTQKRVQEDVAALLNKQISKTQAAAKQTVTPSRSWTETKISNTPLLKKLETVMAADPEAQQVFSTPDKIRNQQISLNALGFTGPDGKRLPENGVVDLDTLIAWDTKRHGSGIFGNANSAIMRAVKGKDGAITEKEIERNPIGKSIYAGLTNLSHAPVRAYFNLFYGGNYDVDLAKNDVGRFFRQALQDQDLINENAELSVAAIDDSTAFGKFKKDILAPLAEGLPSFVQDTALIILSSGASAPIQAAKLPATVRTTELTKSKMQAALNTAVKAVNNIAKQPITAQRATLYFLDDVNQEIENGAQPFDATARAINTAVGKALFDGLAMAVPADDNSTWLHLFLQKKYGRAAKSLGIDLLDYTGNTIFQEQQ